MPRRAGDLATTYTDCTKASQQLHWTANLTVDDACRDSYHFTMQYKPNSHSEK